MLSQSKLSAIIVSCIFAKPQTSSPTKKADSNVLDPQTAFDWIIDALDDRAGDGGVQSNRSLIETINLIDDEDQLNRILGLFRVSNGRWSEITTLASLLTRFAKAETKYWTEKSLPLMSKFIENMMELFNQRSWIIIGKELRQLCVTAFEAAVRLQASTHSRSEKEENEFKNTFKILMGYWIRCKKYITFYESIQRIEDQEPSILRGLLSHFEDALLLKWFGHKVSFRMSQVRRCIVNMVLI
jgi:hypothetical protein